ncbi:MAG: hypothetical protein KDD40_07940, partial [Bdellovibrionales bacterium]|nr:hypothetical protein [Bdellovibrionales bacterium]
QEAIAENDKDPSRLGIETYLQSLNYMGLNDSDPIKYEDQNVAIIGGGDADFGLIENLLGLQVPTQVYGINPHKRRPAKIVNYGAKFAPPELQEFMQNTKERYHHMRGLAGLFLPLHSPLSKSIEDLRPLLGKTLFFNKANVVSLQMVNNGKVQVVDAEGQTEVYDHVILATGYTNEAAYFLNAKFKSLANYSYHQLPEELIPVTGDISITGGSYLPGSAKLVAKDLHYSQARLGLQFKDFPIFLIANAAGAQLIVSDEEALDGSLSAHSRSKDMPRSATFSKYTLQHMLPRAYMAGNQLVLSLFSANTTSSN